MLNSSKLSVSILIVLSLVCFSLEAEKTINLTAQKKMPPKLNKTCSIENCRLPLCRCSSTNRPSMVEIDDTPMMVAITFNGIVSIQHSEYIKKILNPIFKNPNGCPIQSTFFVSDKGRGDTDYCFVQGLFNNHNEIAVGTPNYRCTYMDCESEGNHFNMWNSETAETEIFKQKQNIANKAKINKSFLRGFRLPMLDQKGRAHQKALRKYAMNYDSSVLISARDIIAKKGFRFWPHTMDFPASYDCKTCPNDKELCYGQLVKESNCSYQSLWILPMHYFNAESKNACPMLIKDDIAENRVETANCIKKENLNEEILYKMLVDNFNRHYETNKAPFIVNIETSWFEEFGEPLTNALLRFIDDLTNLKSSMSTKNDIYFVTLSKIVEWMEYPVPLQVIGSRWLWDCDGLLFDYDAECDMSSLAEKRAELENKRNQNKTALLDLHAEDLFRNGVGGGVIIAFVLSITFTLLYDKYSTKNKKFVRDPTFAELD